MKRLIIILNILIISLTVFSQTLIEIEKVPKPVVDAFKKKATKSQEIKWFKVKEGFMVKYTFSGQEEEAVYTKTGEVVKTKVKVDPEKLPKVILDDLDANHSKKEIDEAFLVTEGKKDKYYSIILHEQKKKKEAPLVFEIQYTVQGKLITIYEPDEIYADTDDDEYEDDDNTAKIENEAETLSTEVNGEKVKSKDLPSSIQEYMKKSYSYEYKYKVCQIIQHEKYNECYYIIMKKQGEKKQFVHYFDTNGNLLEVKEE
jgi:hypothetical protein